MYFVYILFSDSSKRFYTGQTQNLERRLLEHSSGENTSTRHGKPWKLVHEEQFATRAEAIAREAQIKKRGAKRYLEDTPIKDSIISMTSPNA